MMILVLMWKVVDSGEAHVMLMVSGVPSPTVVVDSGSLPCSSITRSTSSPSAVYSRHEAWLMKREEKLEERRREKEEASMRECVFKPKTTTTGRRGSKMGPHHVVMEIGWSDKLLITSLFRIRRCEFLFFSMYGFVLL